MAIGAVLHLVRPIAFRVDEKAVRRAGLDYWRHVRLVLHEDDERFWGWADGRRLHLLSSRGQEPYTSRRWSRGDVLVLGPEADGLPESWIVRHGAIRIPMGGPTRSLNVANAASIVAYRALQDIEPSWFTGPTSPE